MSKKESWDEFLRKNASSITENHLSSDEFAAKERADTSSYSHRSFQETVPPRRVESLLTEAMTSAVRNETCLDCECMRVSSGLLTRLTRTDSHSNIVSASWNKKKITKETRHKSSCKRKKTDKKSSMATNTDLRSIVKKRGSRKASRSSGSGSSRESSRRQKYCNFEVELKKETPIEKLKRFLRSVRIIVEVCLALKSYVKKAQEAPTLVEMQMKLQEDFNKRLTFNPHYYNASYVANKGSSKLKKLLAISPAARTKRHVKMIHTLVENKSAFSKHPARIRMRMCQVMIYQCYGARRVIIKQGHPPSAFYIILSGTCLINAKELDGDGVETNQTVNELQEGEVFGEVALLTNSSRTASVVCKDEVELLVVYKEDFDAIIRGPIYRQREEVVNYCKNIQVLSDWPVDLLSSASVVNFYFQYFRKGSVIIKNSASANFLVFIKSGECHIVCTLDGEPENGLSKSRNKSMSNKAKLPLISALLNDRASRAKQLSVCYSNPQNLIPPKLPVITKSNDSHSVTRSLEADDSYRTRRKAVVTFTPGANRNVSQMMWHRIQSGAEHMKALESVQEFSLGQNLGNQRLKVLRRSIRASVIEDTPYAIVKKDPALVKIEQRRNVATVFNGGNAEDSAPATSPWFKPKVKPKFAQIAVLQSGYVFGLEEMMRRTKLRLSLVSDGAECVFISKKLFLKHAGPKTLRCLNSMIGKYPTEEFIRHQLDKQAVWKDFREEVVKGVLEKREEKMSLPSFLKAT